VPIRLEDLPASLPRRTRAAAEAQRTIELYSQAVRCSSRWLTHRVRAVWTSSAGEADEPSG
jgi:hypothetical protein